MISPDESQALKYPPWTVRGTDEPAGQNLSAPPHSFCTRLVLPALREGVGGGRGAERGARACARVRVCACVRVCVCVCKCV